jgi:hypothetical protein
LFPALTGFTELMGGLEFALFPPNNEVPVFPPSKLLLVLKGVPERLFKLLLPENPPKAKGLEAELLPVPKFTENPPEVFEAKILLEPGLTEKPVFPENPPGLGLDPNKLLEGLFGTPKALFAVLDTLGAPNKVVFEGLFVNELLLEFPNKAPPDGFELKPGTELFAVVPNNDPPDRLEFNPPAIGLFAGFPNKDPELFVVEKPEELENKLALEKPPDGPPVAENPPAVKPEVLIGFAMII